MRALRARRDDEFFGRRDESGVLLVQTTFALLKFVPFRNVRRVREIDPISSERREKSEDAQDFPVFFVQMRLQQLREHFRGDHGLTSGLHRLQQCRVQLRVAELERLRDAQLHWLERRKRRGCGRIVFAR